MEVRGQSGRIYGGTVSGTPLGNIRIWAGAHGIKKLAFEDANRQETNKVTTIENELIHDAIKQLGQYLSGGLKRFDLPLDLSNCTPFQQDVFQEIQKIPYGQTLSYKSLADSLDKPQASRSVGQALKVNPIPVIVPCHRIIRSNGTLGGYSGNSAANLKKKKTLLQIEGLEIGRNTVRNMNQEELFLD
ncbi:MAG: cysteine methyltransferase [Gemmatimonadetes bacterium]|nr:cysteine methyltransferase [Gemmatimonadota bacterium]